MFEESGVSDVVVNSRILNVFKRRFQYCKGLKDVRAGQEENHWQSTRLTEHKRATRNGDVNNHIAEYHLQTKHQIDWDSATCITYSIDYHQRLTLESWFTNLEQTPLNRSQQLPAPYKRLIDEMKRN